MNEKRVLAFKMRHSVQAAEEFYKKFFDLDNEEDCEEERTELKIIKTKIHKDADQAILDKKYKKKRYDVVRNLNVKGIKPLKSSILNYKLVQDAEGKWL
jgi:hypothetical protein